MKYYVLIALCLLLSCAKEKNTNGGAKTDSIPPKGKENGAEMYGLTNRTLNFLWRENRYDDEVKDTIPVIVINKGYGKKLTDPERAALGYVATFVGSDCQWDGEANDDRSNLKCKVLTALDLGYQCSERHLGFLRQWFKNDKKVLAALETCPTIPDMATSQETFDEIRITVRGNKISIYFKVAGINTRKGESWNYKGVNHFLYNKNTLKLIYEGQSDVEREHFGDEDLEE